MQYPLSLSIAKSEGTPTSSSMTAQQLCWLFFSWLFESGFWLTESPSLTHFNTFRCSVVPFVVDWDETCLRRCLGAWCPISPKGSIVSMSLFLTLPSLWARSCVLGRGYPPVRVEGRGECWWTILSNWILVERLECWSPYGRSGACSHSGDKMTGAKE